MNHLIPQWDMERIESSLIERRTQLVEATAWTFNIVMLLAILASFMMFLYVQYDNHQEKVNTEKHIPFTPTTWYSATRNVRAEEYGRQLQPIETEVGYGISGIASGTGGTAF